MSDQTVHTAFELPALPYGLQDLEPHLGEETLKVHHGRHHAKYVENLNRLLAGQDLAGVSLEGVLRRASESNQTALFNNAAQTWNHAFFWESMSARSSVPDGQLAQACLGKIRQPEQSAGAVYFRRRRTFRIRLGLARGQERCARGSVDT